jgi:hypothetical protein
MNQPQRVRQPRSCIRVQSRQTALEIAFVFVALCFRFEQQNGFGPQTGDSVAQGDHARARCVYALVSSEDPGISVSRFQHDIHSPQVSSRIEHPVLMFVFTRQPAVRQQPDFPIPDGVKLESREMIPHRREMNARDRDFDVFVGAVCSAEPEFDCPPADDAPGCPHVRQDRGNLVGRPGPPGIEARAVPVFDRFVD